MAEFSITVLPTDTKLLEKFTEIWGDVWLEEGYATPQTIQKTREHYTLFHPFSTDFLLSADGCFVGTMRIIWNNPMGFPALNDFDINTEQRAQFATEALCELTLLTVRREYRYRGSAAFLAMLATAYPIVLDHGVTGILAAADRRLWVLLRRLGFPFVQIGKSKLYEGSETIPGIMLLPELAQAVLQAPPTNALEAAIWSRHGQ